MYSSLRALLGFSGGGETKAVPSSYYGSLSTEDFSSSEDSVVESSINKDDLYPPRNVAIWHVAWTVFGSLWWYAFCSVTIWNYGTYEFAGCVLTETTIRCMAAYILLSQIYCYRLVWLSTRYNSLREAQLSNLLTDCICVPADGMVVFFNPTGNKLTTVLGFAIATTFFGTMMVHHLREASFREEEILARATNPTSCPTDHPRHHGARSTTEHQSSLLQALINYRPQNNFGSIYSAVRLSKAFVSFIIVLDAFVELADEHGDGEHPADQEEGKDLWLYSSLTTVLLHTSIEVILRTIFPGLDIHHHPGVLVLHMVLYFVHMVAASIVAEEESFIGDSVWDNLVNTWLFASGSVGFVQSAMSLLEHVDMDTKFGLVSSFVR